MMKEKSFMRFPPGLKIKKVDDEKKMKLMHSHSKDELRERREERRRVYGCSESV